MSLTLGEKLRQAREEKGIAISEVAEQTRISPLYIQSIENDDYRALPGGIFNRGFVKSFAKYVGVDEQEALLDYATLLTETEGSDVDEVKTYKPQVLTDDRSSMIPTLIVAAIILGLMTGGILFLVRYLRQPAESSAEHNAIKANINSAAETEATPQSTPSTAPDMATAIFEIAAIGQSVQVISVMDTEPPKSNKIAAGSLVTFSPKESLTLSYLRWNAGSVQLLINHKQIVLPTEPLDPRDKEHIVFTISKNNLLQIWTNGMISTSSSTLPPLSSAVNTIPEPPTVQSPSVVSHPNILPRPGVAVNAAREPPTRMTNTPKPSPMVKPSISTKPAGNRPQ